VGILYRVFGRKKPNDEKAQPAFPESDLSKVIHSIQIKNIGNLTAKESIRILCDNLVTDSNGNTIIAESMFSNFFDLTIDYNEVLLRIHPQKKKFFDSVQSGTTMSVSTVDPKTAKPVNLKFSGQIDIHVNNPKGGLSAVNYSKLPKNLPESIVNEIHIDGFDENAAPIIRVLKDNSLRLVFCSLPPSQNRLGKNFDMDHFGNNLQKSVTAEIEWDDREVFYVKSQENNTIEQIINFIKNYRGIA
jgi:hypothetical protein